MKKIVIVLLILAVAGGVAFSQVSVKADLRFNNVASEDAVGEMYPSLGLIFNGAASQELGPGSLSFGVQLSPRLNFTDKAGLGIGLDADDNYGDITYSLGAGPGVLGVGLTAFINLAPIIGAFSAAGYDGSGGVVYRPHIDYTGIAAGPAKIGVGIYGDFPAIGLDKDGKSDPFGNADAGKESLGVWVTATFDFGLYLKVGFDYGWGEHAGAKGDGKSGVKRILYVDVNYAVLPAPLLVGVELDNTGAEFKGITLKPYVSYTIDANMSAGVYFIIDNMLNEKPADYVVMSPGLWFKYTL